MLKLMERDSILNSIRKGRVIKQHWREDVRNTWPEAWSAEKVLVSARQYPLYPLLKFWRVLASALSMVNTPLVYTLLHFVYIHSRCFFKLCQKGSRSCEWLTCAALKSRVQIIARQLNRIKHVQVIIKRECHFLHFFELRLTKNRVIPYACICVLHFQFYELYLQCFYEKNYQRLYILEADPALWKGGGQLMIINACKIWYLPKHIFSVRLIYQVTYYFNIRVHRIKQSMPVFIYSLLNVLVFVRKQLL